MRAGGEDVETKSAKEEREENQCEEESHPAKETRQVGEQEEELCEEDLAGHCARWGEGEAY